jgi:hypothetical protein
LHANQKSHRITNFEKYLLNCVLSVRVDKQFDQIIVGENNGKMKYGLEFGDQRFKKNETFLIFQKTHKIVGSHKK